jgi:hypothetical protein
MQQDLIPVPPSINFSNICAVWRKVHTGHIIFQFLHGLSVTVVFSADTEGPSLSASLTYDPVCASACAVILILSFVVSEEKIKLSL